MAAVVVQRVYVRDWRALAEFLLSHPVFRNRALLKLGYSSSARQALLNMLMRTGVVERIGYGLYQVRVEKLVTLALEQCRSSGSSDDGGWDVVGVVAEALQRQLEKQV